MDKERDSLQLGSQEGLVNGVPQTNRRLPNVIKGKEMDFFLVLQEKHTITFRVFIESVR